MNPIERLANRLANQCFGLLHSFGQRHSEVPSDAKIVAHRGVHQNGRAQENTLAAFDLALKNNLWGIELDLHFTADDVPVIHHDPHLGRYYLQRDRLIQTCTHKELKKLAPTLCDLEEVVQRYGGKMHLMLEIKQAAATRSQKHALQNVLAKLAPVEQYHLMSLQPDLLDSVDWLTPKSKIDIAVFNVKDAYLNGLAKRHGGLAGHFLLLNSATVQAAKSQGLTVGTGYIENHGTFARERQRGVEWIFTDTPLQLLDRA